MHFARPHETLQRADGDAPWTVAVRLWRAAKTHRTTGHAAEVAFFAVLTLVPSTVAVGSALGLSEGLIGAAAVSGAEDGELNATLRAPPAARSGHRAPAPVPADAGPAGAFAGARFARDAEHDVRGA